ncbi:MAG: hypothetical protein JWO46_1591 [Nocardioidaceae bacterium]|nr:hypothetical protein [Nocardioidaceae bacterium]
MSSERFAFDWDPSYRLPALLFGISPSTAYAEVGTVELYVRFGLWSLRTPLTNIKDVTRSGDFAFLKTAGPPHLSFSDHGVTFATTGRQGVCLSLREPVKAIDPTGRVVHPGATLTVARPDAFVAALGIPGPT